MPNINLADFQLLRMWPRALFKIKNGNGTLKIKVEVPQLKEFGGVYVLYKGDEPYYVGMAATELWGRLHKHANIVSDNYYPLWDYFSAFLLVQPGKDSEKKLIELEAFLIAAIPRATNRSTPRFTPLNIPKSLMDV